MNPAAPVTRMVLLEISMLIFFILVALEEVAGVDFVMSLLYPLVCLFLTLFFLSNLADGANLLIFALFASGYNQFGDVFWSLFSEAAFKEGEAALFVG